MKPLYTFKVGSSVFFQESKDIDYLIIMDSFIPGKLKMKAQIGNDDIFMYKPDVTKEEFVQELVTSGVNMKAGKFLVPDFCKHIGFTIEDLKKLKPYFYNMDDKHKYEKLIYDAYLENNDFVLTDKQRDSAYQEYRKERK